MRVIENRRLSSLLGKLNTQDQVSVTETVHLLTCYSSIGTIDKRNESEALGATCFAVFGQEDAGDATETFEEGAKFVFFGEFGDLC